MQPTNLFFFSIKLFVFLQLGPTTEINISMTSSATIRKNTGYFLPLLGRNESVINTNSFLIIAMPVSHFIFNPHP